MSETSIAGAGVAARPKVRVKPQGLRVTLSSLLSVWRYTRVAFGVYPRECPLCGFAGYFHACGMPPRIDSRCPSCNSLERHRLLACFLDQREMITGRAILHFAPEASIVALVELFGPATYVKGDLNPLPGDAKLDIERLEFADAAFDTIICSHVLEHVDDTAALAEMRRVLKPDGHLLLMIPVIEGWAKTYENPLVVTPEDRTMHYGQFDHVRYYGRDVRNRVRAAGFEIEEWTGSPGFVLRYGLQRGETIFVCRPA